MDPRRIARYVDQIDHARDRLALVKEWTPRATKDVQARLATYKAFQEAADAASDVAAMALIDAGKSARDDYGNFARAAEAGIFSPALVEALTESTGLRNRLVHEYDGVNTARALVSIERLLPALGRFFEEVEAWARSKIK